MSKGTTNVVIKQNTKKLEINARKRAIKRKLDEATDALFYTGEDSLVVITEIAREIKHLSKLMAAYDE